MLLRAREAKDWCTDRSGLAFTVADTYPESTAETSASSSKPFLPPRSLEALASVSLGQSGDRRASQWSAGSPKPHRGFVWHSLHTLPPL